LRKKDAVVLEVFANSTYNQQTVSGSNDSKQHSGFKRLRQMFNRLSKNKQLYAQLPSLAISYTLMSWSFVLLAEQSNVELGANYSEGIATTIPGGIMLFAMAVGLIVLLLVILGSLSSSSSTSKKALQALASGPSAQNLFLGIKYQSLAKNAQAQENSEGDIAYLRSLGVTSASFVCSEHLTKDSKVSLALGSLPGFPDTSLTVEGHVIRCKSLGGVPESFMVQIRFGHVTDKTRLPLLNYLSMLTHKPTAFSQA
jgi:hypothetical protein